MYSAKIDGEPTTFGTSGLLYRSNKLMYDRTTRSIWSQLLGEPVIGTLADSGIRLDYFPVNLTTWQEWREQHPDTTVLSRETGVYPPDVYQSENDPSSFYFDYRNSPRTMFPVWQRDDSLNAKDQVIIVRAGGVSKAYPLRALQSERVVNDAVGGVNVVLVSGSATTLSAAAYERGGEVFAAPPGYLASDPNGPPPQELRDLTKRHGTLLIFDEVVTGFRASAGGAQEPIDPVRVVTNRSSGKMGYAIAEAARDRGASVVLVSAPTALEDPAGVRVIPVETSEEMRNAVREAAGKADALVMAAAVADYRPLSPSARKIKREASASLSIEMERTADIIAGAPSGIVRVAFAAESDNLLANARAKLRSKAVDLVVANDITLPDAGFGADTNKVWLVDDSGDVELPLISKYEVAMAILDRVASRLAEGVPSSRRES